MRRFFIDTNDIDGKAVTIRGSEFIHMTKVLRCKSGETFVLLDGLGFEYTATLNGIYDDYATFVIKDKMVSDAEPQTKVTLYQGMPKSIKLDTIVQKAVELGAYAIVPFVSKRCVRTPKDFDKKSERLVKIATEAVKQSKRAIVPKIGRMLDDKQWVSAVSAHALTLICYEDEHMRTLKQALRSSDAKDIGVVIGPEGGFEPSEIEALTVAGAVSVSLGKRILRTETAGMAVLAQIMYEKEDA